jgi:hypothetical protein
VEVESERVRRGEVGDDSAFTSLLQVGPRRENPFLTNFQYPQKQATSDIVPENRNILSEGPPWLMKTNWVRTESIVSAMYRVSHALMNISGSREFREIRLV